MHKDDHSYKAFAGWLHDVANSMNGSYEVAQTLPSDNWFPTEHVVRIKGLPSEWPNLSTVQVFVHRWDSENRDWSDEPVAFTQTKITPKKIINGTLFLIASEGQKNDLSSQGETLAAGRVQLRIYLDRDNVVDSDPMLLLNNSEPDATAIIQAKFQKGFKNAEIVDGVDSAGVQSSLR